MENFDILKNSPTLIYPNGEENIIDDDINIQWIEPSDIPSDMKIWYEIYITDSFDNNRDSNFIQIGVLPQGKSNYSYKINKNLRGKKCRVAIRSVDQNGTRGKLIYSSSFFSILNKKIMSPSLFEPLDGNVYFSYVPFVFNYDGIKNSITQRLYYRIFYKSDISGVDWTLLVDKLNIDTKFLNIDTKNFQTSSDYEFKVEITDGLNVSSPLFINNISINNLNYFLIDTIPPVGEIKIKNNSEYTKNRDIIVSLNAYDETTGVKSYSIKQINTNDSSEINGFESDFSDVASWKIQGNDGVKIIASKFVDYAGNFIDEDTIKNFRTYKSLDNKIITSYLKDDASTDIWFSFWDENSLSYLYRNQNLVVTVDGMITYLKFYKNILYVAIRDENNKGILKRSSGLTVEDVQNNNSEYLDDNSEYLNYLYLSDSVINTMEVFDSKLFLGMQNGSLLSFDGSVLVMENNSFLNSKEIKHLYNDGNMLYIYFSNDKNILSMYKDENSNYVFYSIEIGI